ncbi:MAG: ABC transporter permease [Candidatus Limisoma sp.]|nr:ABC transporter permease [Muribaculaceae bacterium]MDY5827962.1 ABC transporter permease [Candidatus Limisoma sp.]
MKSKIWIVTQREFATRVKKKSFIIMTLLMPFLMSALMFLPLLLSLIESSDKKTVAVVDQTGLYQAEFKSNDKYLFVPTEKMTPQMRSDSTDVAAVLLITADLSEKPGSAALYSQEEIPSDLSDLVNSTLTDVVQRQKFAKYNIPELDAIIDDVQTPVEVEKIRWTDEGERQSMSDFLSGVGMLLTFVIYMFVMAYGAMVLQSVSEEKSNRIVELMVSSVKPFQLMMGKIIGIGLVGVFQVLIWAVIIASVMAIGGTMTGVAMFGSGDMTAMQGADMDAGMKIFAIISQLPLLEIISLFVLYFVGGYLLYASILAALGASVNDQQDTGQMMMPVMIVMVFAFYVGFYSSMNPDGPMAFWCSFVPFTSPIVMMVRIPFGVPLYQEIISVALLYATAIALTYLGSRIYRIGILMYGKKPSFKEIFKWLKF